jgi:RecA-family ATPase
VDPTKVPRHRQWVYSTKLIKGELTVLAAKGGWGKSAYAIGLSCAAGAGRDLLGEDVWGGQKRVLYINSEDDVDELNRRFIAAYRHHKMTSAELAKILVRGVDSHGHESLTTGDDSAAKVNEAGFVLLDNLIREANADIVVLDPLGTFCPAGLNNNGLMGQVFLRLKRLARKHDCAVLIVHHTRKDGDLTNTDAIGGASAIVNQARVALLIARLTKEEAKSFPGVLDSQLWRYFRVVDAKTNLAPPSANTQWYQLNSHDHPNAEPPTYRYGDGVQVVDEIEVAQLNTSPVPNSTNDAAKRAILKAAHNANPPFSPSAKGGSARYIVPNVLDAVRQATGLSWADRDLVKH